MQLITAPAASRETALAALARLDDAEAAGRVTVEDAALVQADGRGGVRIHRIRDVTAGPGAMRGSAVAVVAALVAAPGAEVGGPADGRIDPAPRGLTDRLLRQVGALLAGGGPGLLILTDEASLPAVVALTGPAMADGAEAQFETVPPEGQRFIRERLRRAMG